MSKHEKLIQAVTQAVVSLEQSASDFERLANMMPRDFSGADMMLPEVAETARLIPRLQHAHARLATAQILLSARLGAKT